MPKREHPEGGKRKKHSSTVVQNYYRAVEIDGFKGTIDDYAAMMEEAGGTKVFKGPSFRKGSSSGEPLHEIPEEYKALVRTAERRPQDPAEKAIIRAAIDIVTNIIKEVTKSKFQGEDLTSPYLQLSYSQLFEFFQVLTLGILHDYLNALTLSTDLKNGHFINLLKAGMVRSGVFDITNPELVAMEFSPSIESIQYNKWLRESVREVYFENTTALLDNPEIKSSLEWLCAHGYNSYSDQGLVEDINRMALDANLEVTVYLDQLVHSAMAINFIHVFVKKHVNWTYDLFRNITNNIQINLVTALRAYSESTGIELNLELDPGQES